MKVHVKIKAEALKSMSRKDKKAANVYVAYVNRTLDETVNWDVWVNTLAAHIVMAECAGIPIVLADGKGKEGSCLTKD